MPGVLHFPESYDAVRVPDPIRSMDAIDQAVVAAEEQFFAEIRDSLQITYLALSSFCKINHRMLVPMHRPALSFVDQPRESDDSLSEFWLEGVQPLATVLKTRDDWNWQVASFAKFPLLPRTIEVITELRGIDGIIKETTGL